jgi:PKD repeat protein
MKKLTFLFIFILSFSAVFAQVTRDKVVVEVGTGTWCPYCPGAAMGVDDLIENGWPVAPIENHNGDAFANQYSNARNSFYGIPGYPTAYFDGGSAVIGGDHTQSMYPSYWPKVQQRMGVPSPVSLQVYGTNSGLTYNVTVTVTKESEITGSNIRLHLCLTESHIVYSWQGQSELNFVNRLMVPDQNGTILNFDNSDELEIPLTFTINPSWNFFSTDLVVFVQTNSNKVIQNAFRVTLAFLEAPPPPLVAAFVSDTITCVTNQVQFENQSNGNPTAWYWEFEGGTPDTSTEEDPIITYNTAGKFDVKLIVTKDNDSDTTLMEDYMDVFDPPIVAFDPLDDQCINYPPLELTSGSPAGGIYSGPGVEDGFFHPDMAGAGTHTLVYTYTDENGCGNFAEQTVLVDACTGIPENKGVQIFTIPNPTQGSFKFSITGMEDMVNLRIINATGKTVFQRENIEVNDNFNTMIDLSGNSNGIYYINIEGKKSTYFRKVILQN